MDAFRHGQALGSGVWTPQPPVFYYLLALGDLLFGNTLDGVRVVIIVMAFVAVGSTYGIGRLMAGHAAGLVSAALLLVSIPFYRFGARISADLPGVALALFALLCAVAGVREERRLLKYATAFAAGISLALAVGVKLDAIIFLLPVGFVILRDRNRRTAAWVVAGTVLAAVIVVGVNARGLGGIWHGAVSYHVAARDVGSGIAPGSGTSLYYRLIQLVHFLDPRTRNPLCLLGPLALFLCITGRTRALTAQVLVLWATAALASLFLIVHSPLHDNHYVIAPMTIALPTGIAIGAAVARMGRTGILLLTAVTLATIGWGYGRALDEALGTRGPDLPQVVWAAMKLRATTRPDELVVADRPGTAFLAHRVMPGDLVDSAYLRFGAGFLTDAQVLRDIDRYDVRAVAVDRAYLDHPAILAGLPQRFRTSATRFGATVYFNRSR